MISSTLYVAYLLSTETNATNSSLCVPAIVVLKTDLGFRTALASARGDASPGAWSACQHPFGAATADTSAEALAHRFPCKTALLSLRDTLRHVISKHTHTSNLSTHSK